MGNENKVASTHFQTSYKKIKHYGFDYIFKTKILPGVSLYTESCALAGGI